MPHKKRNSNYENRTYQTKPKPNTDNKNNTTDSVFFMNPKSNQLGTNTNTEMAQYQSSKRKGKKHFRRALQSDTTVSRYYLSLLSLQTEGSFLM